jgi:hypothetical protein
VRRKTVNLMWEKKVKLSHRKSWKIRWGMECLASILTLSLSQLGRHSCQLEEPVPLYPQGNSFPSFLLEAKWTPELMNADRKIRPLQNFQRLYRESNPRRPVLGSNASTNCDTARLQT